MNLASSSPISKRSTVSRRFTILTIMFLSVLVGMSVYTMTTLQKGQSNAFVIDLAGRQRMLIQKHMNEILLTSQGIATDYASTRALITSTLTTLMTGGSVASNAETGQRKTIPAAPTQKIQEKLREQQEYITRIFQLADQFLLLSPDHPEFRPQLLTLRTQHALTIRTADEAVKQFDDYSEAAITSMVKWEILIAIIIGWLGMFVTSKGVRDGRRLEKEIDERKHAESALQASENFLNSIIENIPDMIFVKSAKDLRFVRLNKAGEELLESSREQILGKSDYDLFPKEQAEFFIMKDQEVLTEKHLVNIIQEPIQTKSHGIRQLHTKKIPLLDDQGNPQYLLGISNDITERLHAQEALRQSEERYRALYEDNPSMYFTVAQNGKILSVNHFGAQQLGFAVADLVGLPVIDLFLEEDRPRVFQRFETCLQNPLTVFSWEYRKVRKNRSVLWVKEVARAVYNQEKELVVLIVCEDISERKESEKALQEWKTLTESVLGQLPKGFAYRCLNNKNWTAVYVSDGIEEVTGFSASDLLSGNINYDSLLAPGENEQVWANVQEALAKHLPYENEHRIITSDGKMKWILARGRFIFDDAGQLLYLDGLNVDITERKQAEERLRESEAKRMNALQQSDDLKSALLSSVSHELRTPLTAIKTSVSNIMGNPSNKVNEVQQEALNGIDQEINYMSRLVDNLLDMSQIEAGTLIPHREWHLFEDLLEGALRRTEQYFETRDLQIQIPEDISPVFVDAVEIQQVLINLLDNAVKYSPPESPIRLLVRVDPQQIEVEVSNTGEPIQAQDLERIFDRFYRRRSPSEEQIRGTGLGLAICKGLIEAHGGRIWAESMGKNVTIAFTIPATEAMATFSLEGLHKGEPKP
ncbi:MAG: PAS domain S-box protein [Nitrospirota bacterium]|nr:PAS domain S-box protein [Nitrospirota bacterium]